MAVLGSDNLTHSTTFKFNINSKDNIKIDSDGRLLVGPTSMRSNFFASASGQPVGMLIDGTEGNSFDRIAIINSTADNIGGPDLILGKSRSSGNTIVQNNDILGNLIFDGNNGTAFLQGASIIVKVTGTPSSVSMPAQLIFCIRGVERTRILNSGSFQVGLNMDSTADVCLDVFNINQRYLFREGRIDCVNITNTAWGTFVARAENVQLRTSNDTTRLEVRSGDGMVHLVNNGGARNGNGTVVTTSNNSVGHAVRQAGYIEWQTDVGAVGTTYFLSDITKKENISPSNFNSLDLIDQIEFIQFDWNPDSGNSGRVNVGVSAQQLQTIDARLVHELSDNTLMVNEPALVSHLAKSVQELISKIETLEAKVLELEAS